MLEFKNEFGLRLDKESFETLVKILRGTLTDDEAKSHQFFIVRRLRVEISQLDLVENSKVVKFEGIQGA